MTNPLSRTFLRSTLVAISLMTLLACAGESNEERMVRAKQYLSDADYKSATIELKNVLQKDAESAEARWLLGKLYLDTGDVLSAEKELRGAERRGWDVNDIHPALAAALLRQGKFAEVEELRHQELTNSAAAKLLSSKALAALALGKADEAQELVTEALTKEPDLLAAKMAEARILAAQQDLTGALIVLTEVVSQDADHAPAWSLQGNILMSQAKLEEAKAAFDKSIKLSPGNVSDRLNRALVELQLGNNDAALADANAILKNSSRNPAGNYIVGLLHFGEQKYEEAISALSLAEPAAQQFPMVLFYLGSAHLIENNQDQAAFFAARFYDAAPDNIAGRKLLATIKLLQGKFDEIRDLLQPVLDDNPEDIGALNLMANALLRNGETDEGITLLARVAELQPNSPAAQVRLGAGLLLTGKEDAAAQRMETALELNPEFQQADILLILNHVQQGDFDQAIEAAKAYRRRNPASVTPHNLLGRVYLASGSEEQAIASFDKALALDPGDPAANLNLAKLSQTAGDLDAARKRYETILVHYPDFLRAQLELARMAEADNKEEEMVSRLQEAKRTHPSAIEPRLMLGRYYLSNGKSNQISLLFADLDPSQKQSPQVLQLLAAAQLAEQDHTGAQDTLEQLVASSSSTASSHHMLAMAAAGTGDVAKTREELERALALDENYLPSLVALARMAFAEQATAEFEQYKQKLVTLAPDSADVLRLQAMDAQRNGDSQEAVGFATKAFAANPTTQAVIELYRYETLAGNAAEGRQLLENWIKDNPQDIQARLALANDLIPDGKISEAKTQYVAILELEPDNITALNNLAWYLRLEEPEKALAYARHAADISPDQPEVLDTLAVIEHINGEDKQALRNVQRALAAAPGNPSMLYHRAMIEAALGNETSATTILQKLLAEGAPDFPELAEAKALLEKLQG